MAIYFLYLVSVIMIGWYLLGDKVTIKQKSNCMLAFGLFLVIMMTLRYHIGYDYISYLGIFEGNQASSWGAYFEGMSAASLDSPLFYLLSMTVAQLGGGYHHLLLICNLIMVGCVLWVIYRHSPVWWLSLILYMTLQILPHSMNLLRQSIAASIAFAGWDFLRRGKFWKYAAVILLAACFHPSVLVMIPCYFILRLPFTTPVLVVYGGAMLAGYLLFDPLVNLAVTIAPQYAGYVNASIYGQGNSMIYMIVPFVLAMAAIVLAKPLIARKESNRILVFSAVFTFALYMFMTKMYIVERLSIYFFIYSMLLLPEIVAMFRDRDLAMAEGDSAKKHRNKTAVSQQTMATIAVLVISVGYFLFAAQDGFHKTYPYVGVWETQKAVSNDEYYQSHK